MKKIFLFLLSMVLLGNLSLFSQDIKIKKNVVYLDGKEFLKIENDFGNETVLNLKGDQLLILKSYSYSVPNPARNNTNDPGRFNYPATISQFYYVVTFTSFKLEYETELTKKQLFEIFAKYNLLKEDGSVNEENAKSIAAKISREVSGKIPIYIYAH
jgi:hypothetical protein